MKLSNDGRIIIETQADGRIAADAARVGMGDGLADVYRDIDPATLPVAVGRWVSGDVVAGLTEIVKHDMVVDDYLSRHEAAEYLGALGIEQSTAS